MKKFFVLINLCLVALATMAAPVSPSAASRVATNFWQTVLHGKGGLTPCPWQYEQIYLFVGEQGGFVMVSADDCARPIIAYSLHNTIHPDALPIQLSERMAAYSGHIAEAVRQQVDAVANDAAAWKSLFSNQLRKDGDNPDSVAPLIETRWHQDNGYARLTPSHTPVGCAATAQGQMMRYWKYPAFGRGSETYLAGSYGAQSADFAHTLYDWEHMPAEVSMTSPQEEQMAVSTLLYHIGVSLHMGYSPTGSGAVGLAGQEGIPSIDNSLMNQFYYSRKMHPIFKVMGYTDERWADSLKADLQLGHPIIYCGVSPEGGHGFVCDGYQYRDGQIYFHFNFGWSGKGDGYYTADDICPNVSPTGQVGSAYHFTESNQALLHAVPDYGLHVSDTLLTYTREGGDRQLLFASIDTVDSPWDVTVDSPWATVNTNGIDKFGAVTVTAAANTTGSERTAILTFTQNGQSIAVKLLQTYYSEAEYCPLTVIMESTRNGGWEGGAYLSFESPSGYVYNTAALASGSSETVTVGVAPSDVNVVFHKGGSTDRYINYRVLNQYGEELVNVEYAYMNGGTHHIDWPCAHVGIDETDRQAPSAVLWPNPATTMLNISADHMSRAELFDAAGHVLVTLPASATQMDLSGLSAGIYFVRVVTGQGVTIEKIIKK